MEAPESPIEEIHAEDWARRGVRLFIKREDARYLPAYPGDRCLGGNKLRKLKYNLLAAEEQGHDTLLSFGGAYSNHLAALASASRIFGFRAIGVVRGEAAPSLNPTMRHAAACGMIIEYLDRARYRQREAPELLAQWRERYGPYFLVPQGGTNAHALPGCVELAAEIRRQCQGAPPDVVAVACATGGSLAGLIAGMEGESRLLGVAVLKGGFLTHAVRELLEPTPARDFDNWAVLDEFHGGGYAKVSPPLRHFIRQFQAEHGVPLDPVYTGKLFFALYQLLERGVFPPGSRVLAIHTGGLQGAAKGR
jgi:1-aminocyclopropane-1-carboxylate deaminase